MSNGAAKKILSRPAKPSPDDTLRPDFHGMAARAMRDAPKPLSPAEAEKQRIEEERAQREERFRVAGLDGPITDEGVQALIEGKLYRTRALDAVQHWYGVRSKVKRPFAVMVLVGDTGEGKTLAAAWLILELGGGVYTTAEELRKRGTSKHWQDREWLERLKTCRVLVIDDVGTERDLDDMRVALYEVVNARQGLKRGWTLLTGNFTIAMFRERYGRRTLRRIEDQGVFIEVHDQDRRRKPMDELEAPEP